MAAFAGSFAGDFHYDDSLTILENPHMAGWHAFVSHIDHIVRPVLYASFLLDRSLYGGDPAGYHLFNLLLHLGSGLLVYRVFCSAVPERQSSLPFWTALLFLVHPITTETVTYISGRASGLMAFCYLLALFLYLQASEQSHTVTFRRLYLSGAVASFALSIGSKETAVTLPLILLLWDALIRRRRDPDFPAAMLARHAPFWIVLVLAAAWAWNNPRYTALAQFSFELRPAWDHVLTQIHAVAFTVLLLFTPWNQNFDHDLPLFHSLTQWPMPLDLLLIFGLLTAALLLVRRLPLASFGLAWFFIQLLPTSVIPRTDVLSERNLYLPAIGFLLAFSASVLCLTEWMTTKMPRWGRVRIASAALAIAVVVGLSFFTYQRNLLFRDRLLLWSDAAQKSPNKARPHNNLGYAYSLHGDWDRAIGEFRTAVRLDPGFILARENLRDAYLHHVGRP
jgi:tetratricopeptide (TPR) repeat protein